MIHVLSSEHKKETVVIIRPSFKKICANDPCQAALFNQLFYQIAEKAKHAHPDKMCQGEVYYYESAEDMRSDLLAESWSVNKIRQEITRLVASGLIGHRNNPYNQWDQTYFYSFGEQQGDVFVKKCREQGVCLHHLDLPEPMLHVLRMLDAFTKFGECICQKEDIELPKRGHRIAKNGAAITKNPSENTTKKINKDSLVALTCNGEGSFSQEKSSQNGKAPLTLSASPTEEVGSKEPPRVVALLDATTPEPIEKNTKLPTQIALLPAVLVRPTPPEGTVKTPSPDKTVGKDDSKTFEQRQAKQLAIRHNKRKKLLREAGFTPEQQALYETWETRYNERCGGEPEEDGAFYAAVNDLIKLVKKFSGGQLQTLDNYYTREHFKWKQPTWLHDLGAKNAWIHHQGAIATLTAQGRWPARDALPGQALSQSAPSQQEDVYTRKIRELAAESAARYTTPHMQGVAL